MGFLHSLTVYSHWHNGAVGVIAFGVGHSDPPIPQPAPGRPDVDAGGVARGVEGAAVARVGGAHRDGAAVAGNGVVAGLWAGRQAGGGAKWARGYGVGSGGGRAFGAERRRGRMQHPTQPRPPAHSHTHTAPAQTLSGARPASLTHVCCAPPEGSPEPAAATTVTLAASTRSSLSLNALATWASLSLVKAPGVQLQGSGAGRPVGNVGGVKDGVGEMQKKIC